MNKTNSSQLPNILIVALLTGAVLLIAVWNYIAAAGYNFFAFTDNLLRSFGSDSPALMWAWSGLLLGVAAGGMVATRKYRLKKQWAMGSMAPLIFLFLITLVISGPLGSIVPQPEVAEKKDTLSSGQPMAIAPVIRKHHRTHNTPAKVTDTTQRQTRAIHLLPVNLVAIEDSLTLYYQVAPAKEGPWPEQWSHKFVPQAGEYNLTDDQDQVVKAASIRFFFIKASETVPDAPNFRTLSAGKRNNIVVRSE